MYLCVCLPYHKKEVIYDAIGITPDKKWAYDILSTLEKVFGMQMEAKVAVQISGKQPSGALS